MDQPISPEFDFEDFEDQAEQYRRMAQRQLVSQADADPEQASRALELSSATSVPASFINTDVEGFEKEHKALLNSELVKRNEFLQDYINSHPLAAALSNDDLANLDETSEKIKALPTDTALAKWMQSNTIQQSFERGFGQQPISEMRMDAEGATSLEKATGLYTRPHDIEYALSHPVLAATIGRGVGLGELGVGTSMRVINGLIQMGRDGVAKTFGEKTASAFEDLAQAAIDPATQESLMGLGPAGAIPAGISHGLEVLSNILHAYKAAEPWAKIGKEPPPGIHPVIDEVKAIQAKDDIDRLGDIIQAAQKDATRERNPDFYADNFLRPQLGDLEYGFAPEAIRKLYGDKVPEPDDNLLGWVPDLDKKLAAAEITGSDVRIPAADWIAKVDPEVFKALQDDIRIRPEGVTINESKIEAEPKTAGPDTIQQVRAMAGLEPMTMAGDRFVQLKRRTRDPNAKIQPWNKDMHDIDILDEMGKRIGQVQLSEQKGGKQLYIEMISAGTRENKFYQPNYLGPHLVMDIKRQLKNMFPEAETITGHRVSGARERAGKEMDMPLPEVKLQVPQGWDQVEPFRELLNHHWEAMNPWYEGLQGPATSLDRQVLADAIRREIERILPQKVGEVTTPESMRRIEPDPITGKKQGIGGLVQPLFDAFPKIAIALDSDKFKPIAGEKLTPLDIVRHEAIHQLRRYRFFTDKEWFTLERAARDNGWIQKFGIDRRYPNADMTLKLEEAVAEGFRSWSKGERAKPEVHTLFERIKEMFENIKTRFKELTGKDLDWDEVFKKIESGEIGRREDTVAQKVGGRQLFDSKGLEPSAMAVEPTGREPVGEGIYESGKAAGVTQSFMNNILKLIEKKNIEDLDKALDRREREQRRASNREFKERRTTLRDEVSNDISGRPDIALDQLLSRQRVKFHPAYLTEDQKARLPKDYLQQKDGMNPDDLAPYFGYPSGDALVERLGMLTEDRRRAGMSQKDYFNRLVDVETDRRLNQEFGDRDQHVLDEAKDQALSDTNLDLVHEETLAYAQQAGVEPQLTKDEVRQMVKGAFNDLPVNQISSDRFLQNSGKISQKVSEALAAGKPEKAYQLMQLRQHNLLMARFARDYERERGQYDRMGKQYAKTPTKETAKRIDQSYYPFIQGLYNRFGRRIGRTPEQLAEAIKTAGYDKLSDFVADKMSMLRQLDMPDFLTDPAFKKTKIDDFTYSEFRQLNNFLKQMDFNARNEAKIIREGKDHDVSDLINQAIAAFPKSLEAKGVEQGGKERKAVETTKSYFWSGITLRSMAKRLDGGNPKGILTEFLANTATNADARKTAMAREFMKKLQDIGKVPDMDKRVENTLIKDPNTGQYEPMRKRAVHGMIANWGNISNRTKLLKGYGIEEADAIDWLRRNSKPEDWERQEKIGRIFDEAFAAANNMSYRVSGVPIDKIPLTKFIDPHGVERMGWYSPVEYEDMLPGKSKVKLGANAIADHGYFRAIPSHSYAEARTGYVAPLALNLDAIPVRLLQMIHDIAWREAILDMSKIVFNTKFQNAIISRYGKHQMDEMKSYVKDMANQTNVDSMAEHYREGAFELLRQNTVATLIGLNPSTLGKHTLTAAQNSVAQVGPINFLHQFGAMFRRGNGIADEGFRLAHNKSEVIQARMQNLTRLIRGTDPKFTFEINRMGAWRETMMHWGTAPVAVGDLASAVPTWLAEYKKQRALGESDGFAVQRADIAVIEAHGSSMSSNLPSIMRSGGPMARTFTSLYGFFSHMMQKQYEFAWKAKDIWNGEKPQDIEAHWAPHMANNLWSYWIFPALVEELITPLTNNEKESWGLKAAKVVGLGVSSSMIFVRDFARALLGMASGSPQVGLTGTSLQAPVSFLHDLGNQPFSRQHAGKTVKDAITSVGILSGLTNAQEGRTAEYITRYVQGLEKPKGAWDLATGLRYGTTDKHSKTFNEWWRHMTK